MPTTSPQGDAYEAAVATVLRERRESLGLTQADVAQALGDVTAATVGHWERAFVRVPVPTFMRLAVQAFGVGPADLMREVELKLLDEADDKYWH